MCDHDHGYLCRRRGVVVFVCRKCLQLGAVSDEQVNEIVAQARGEPEVDAIAEERRQHLLECAERTVAYSSERLKAEVAPEVLLASIDGAERIVREGCILGLSADDDFGPLLVIHAELRRRFKSDVHDDGAALTAAADLLLASGAVSDATLRAAATLNAIVLTRAVQAGIVMPELEDIQQRIFHRLGGAR